MKGQDNSPCHDGGRAAVDGYLCGNQYTAWACSSWPSVLDMAGPEGESRAACRGQGRPPEKGVPVLSGEGQVRVTPGTQAEMGIPAES